MNKTTIRTVRGDITKHQFSDDAMIVHGVNCQGVMGSGVAKALRTKYPVIYTEYLRFIDRNSPPLDGLLGQVNYVELHLDFTVANAFTQWKYGGDGKRYVDYDAVYEIFENINDKLNRLEEQGRHQDLYFPKIGAGLAGGNWNIIKTIIEETVEQKFNPTLVELA